MNYLTLRMAFDFVSGAPPLQNTAVVNRKTWEVYYASALLDEDEIPGDSEETDDYIVVPHKNDLGLGRPLVMDFVRECCPEQLDHVRAIFSRKGAYARYKDFLIKQRLLDAWHAYEDERTTAALLEWCKEEGIELEDRQE